jgi:hypothetical protein
MVFLPVDVKQKRQPQNNDFRDLFPKRRRTSEISWKPMAQSAFILVIELKLLSFGPDAIRTKLWLLVLTRFLHANRYPLRLKTL